MRGRMVQFLCIIFSRLNFAFTSNGGLKWVRVNVPQYRIPGEMAQLQCDYDLGNDSLYAVKWYKDHEEFYRFVPRARPEASSYKVEGISVDMNLSDSKKVVLNSLTMRSSGSFRCEVSAEAPSFSSAQSEARLEVVCNACRFIALPKDDPIISGVEVQYRIGDELNLNCTSGRSHPASILHWYVNEQEVTNSEALIQYPQMEYLQGVVSTMLGLRITLTGRHFLGGSMRVKCVASVSPVLWRGDRESIVQSLPINEMREALLLVKSSANERILFRMLLFLHAVYFLLR